MKGNYVDEQRFIVKKRLNSISLRLSLYVYTAYSSIPYSIMRIHFDW